MIAVDSENVAPCYLPSVDRLVPSSAVTIRRLYGHTINLSDIPASYDVRTTRTKSKNATDIQMICDILDCVYTYRNISRVYLVTGDADFIDLILTLRRHNVKTTVLSLPNNTSRQMMEVCDMHFFIAGEGVKVSTSLSPPVQQQQVKQIQPEETDRMSSFVCDINNTLKSNGKIRVKTLRRRWKKLSGKKNLKEFGPFLKSHWLWADGDKYVRQKAK